MQSTPPQEQRDRGRRRQRRTAATMATTCTKITAAIATDIAVTAIPVTTTATDGVMVAKSIITVAVALPGGEEFHEGRVGRLTVQAMHYGKHVLQEVRGVPNRMIVLPGMPSCAPHLPRVPDLPRCPPLPRVPGVSSMLTMMSTV